MTKKERLDLTKGAFLNRLLILKEKHGLPSQINLSSYACDADLKFFRPLEDWEGAAEHSDVMDNCIEVALEMFPSVEFRKIELNKSKYLEWLGDKEDNEAMRATFMSGGNI